MKNKSFRYLLGILVTALALWLSFRNLDWQSLKVSFSRVNVIGVILAGVSVLLSVYIVSWRWQILLKSKAHIPLSVMFRYNIISQYANIVIPARLGELLRAWLAAREYSLSGSYVLGTVLIEKITEIFIVIMLAVLAPIVFTFQAELKGHTAAIVVFLILIPLLVLAIWKRQKVLQGLARLAGIFPGKLRTRLLDFLEKGMEAFTLLKDIRVTLQVFFITFIAIISQVVTNLILFKAYGLKLSIFEAVILQLVLLIGMSLPSIPGRIGVFEYTVYLGLSMFGIEKSIALGYGLMLHLIAYIPKILLGVIFMANLDISLLSIRKNLLKKQDFSGVPENPSKGPLAEGRDQGENHD